MLFSVTTLSYRDFILSLILTPLTKFLASLTGQTGAAEVSLKVQSGEVKLYGSGYHQADVHVLPELPPFILKFVLYNVRHGGCLEKRLV